MHVQLQSAAMAYTLIDLAVLVLATIDCVAADAGRAPVFSIDVWRVAMTALTLLSAAWYAVFELAAASWHWCRCHTDSYRRYTESVVVCNALTAVFLWLSARIDVLVLYTVLFIIRSVLAFSVAFVWGRRWPRRILPLQPAVLPML
jgi:hypothetical protein